MSEQELISEIWLYACKYVYNIYASQWMWERVCMHMLMCVHVLYIHVLHYKHSPPCCAWPVCSPRNRSCLTASHKDTPPSDGLKNRQHVHEGFGFNTQASRSDHRTVWNDWVNSIEGFIIRISQILCSASYWGPHGITSTPFVPP